MRLGFNKKIILIVIVSLLLTMKCFAQSAGEYFIQGRNLYKQGNYSQALESYSKAIAINPNMVKAYYHRGLSYSHLKQYDNAWADVHHAQALGFQYPSHDLEDLKKASGRDK